MSDYQQRGALYVLLTAGYWIGGAVAFLGLLLARLAGPPEWNLIGLGVMVAGVVVLAACYKLREGGNLNKFTYNLSQDYLEVARGALTPIHGKVPSGAEKPEPSSELMNAVFGIVSISIVYSFLALESFLNYQLFRIWEKRGESTGPAKRFVAEFGDVSEFVRLKNHDKFRELPDRLRTLCRLLEYPEPHSAIPDTWRRLHELAEASRHFVVHPYPEPDFFQRNMLRIIQDTESGAYVRVVEEILTFLYTKSDRTVPEWVKANQLIRFRGIDLLPVQT